MTNTPALDQAEKALHANLEATSAQWQENLDAMRALIFHKGVTKEHIALYDAAAVHQHVSELSENELANLGKYLRELKMSDDAITEPREAEIKKGEQLLQMQRLRFICVDLDSPVVRMYEYAVGVAYLANLVTGLRLDVITTRRAAATERQAT